MFNEIQNDFIKSMKNKDKKRLDVIKMLKGSIQLEEKNKKENLTDDEIITIVVKQIKMRKDAIVEFEKGNREDLKNSYQEEIDILSKYLPSQLTIEEVNKIIDNAFIEVNPTSQKDMGNLMKIISPKVKGKADMGIINKIIKDKLANL